MKERKGVVSYWSKLRIYCGVDRFGSVVEIYFVYGRSFSDNGFYMKKLKSMKNNGFDHMEMNHNCFIRC